MLVLWVAGHDSPGMDLMGLQGIRGERAASGREAMEFLRSYDFDVVVTDLELPDSPAHELVRNMRAESINTPVVLLSSNGPVELRVKALDQGADGSLVMPCIPEELIALLRAVVRRSRGHAASVLTHGPITLRLERREVFVHGQPIKATQAEYGALELLLLRRGALLHKQSFLDHLYCGRKEPGTKMVEVIICRLRQKLTYAGAPGFITTVWGYGYRLTEPDEMARDDRPHFHAAKLAWIGGRQLMA